MPTVISPEADDCVVAEGGRVQSIQHTADLAIEVAAGREVGLHSLFPAAGSEHVCVVALGFCHLQPRLWNVLQIAGLHWWQLDVIQGMHVEIFPRHIPGHVGLMEAECQEERTVVLLHQLRDCVIGCARIRDQLVSPVQHPKLNTADAAILQELCCTWN